MGPKHKTCHFKLPLYPLKYLVYNWYIPIDKNLFVSGGLGLVSDMVQGRAGTPLKRGGEQHGAKSEGCGTDTQLTLQEQSSVRARFIAGVNGIIIHKCEQWE